MKMFTKEDIKNFKVKDFAFREIYFREKAEKFMKDIDFLDISEIRFEAPFYCSVKFWSKETNSQDPLFSYWREYDMEYSE